MKTENKNNEIRFDSSYAPTIGNFLLINPKEAEIQIPTLSGSIGLECFNDK